MTYHDVVTKNRRISTRARRMMAVVALCLSSALLAGCGAIGGGGGGGTTTTLAGNASNTTFAANSTMETIKQRGHLLVGIRWDAAPFAYQDPSLGSPAGFDVALVQQIAQTIFGSTNIEGKITYVPLDPRDNELALEQNKVDIVVGRYAISPARKQFVDFAGPYFSDPQSILISKAASDTNQAPTAASDLNGLSVCTVTGSTDVNALKALAPGVVTVDQKSTVAQCGADLQTGVVQAIAASHVDELTYLNNTSTAQMLNTGYAPALYGIGVHKGTNDLRSFLNDQIEAFKYGDAYQADISSDDSNQPDQPPVDRY